MANLCKVLFVVPGFIGQSFWNCTETCEVYGAKSMAAPLGLITVAALLPPTWECRLIDRNNEELTDADLDWADLVMTGGMLPQQIDTRNVIAHAHRRGKPVAVGGPDVTSSPDFYSAADFQVLGEAEGVIADFIAAWESGARRGQFAAEKFAIDVTRTPIPRFDLLKRSQYAYCSVQFSRGCPFTCEFCDIIELYGRVPRTKTAPQILAELDALYRLGHRGHVDFVDDNFIGNKKAVKAFLPHLIAWQKEHGYPFEFSTEASINVADDDALLALMREANFFTLFIGIESPDTDTLVSMQKKQNTRRALAECVHKIYRAGMFVNAGFIIGFDSEKANVASEMSAFIEAAAIAGCTVGLLVALPGTQLTRRLAREGRLFPDSYLLEVASANDNGDHCTTGLNFHTARVRRDILADLRAVLSRVYNPAAYYGRVRAVARMLDLPAVDRSRRVDPPPRTIAGIPLRDLKLLWRLISRIAARQPVALVHFARAFLECAIHNPPALKYTGCMAAMYLHIGPFARLVIAGLDRQIAMIDSGGWQAPATVPEPLEQPVKPARSKRAHAVSVTLP
jgi:radical SAM superfamily enzyme YgiQ (UPF0313 family)